MALRFSDTEQSRADLFTQVHPAVAEYGVGSDGKPSRWEMLLDAYDGAGGFLDGTYLWQFPREKDGEFNPRKAQARYHNYVQPIIDQYKRKLFGGTGPQRDCTDAGLKAFWLDVDGAGTDMTTFMGDSLVKGLTTGDCGILVDKTPDAPTGPAKADEKARVFLTRFLSQAVLDWRVEKTDELIAVKLREDRAPADIFSEADEDETAQILLWDREEWMRVPKDKDLPVEGPNPHGLGLVPFVMLRPLRSTRWPFRGQPLLGDGSIIRALYNRASEEDTVMRDQGFSLFVVSLPTTGEVSPDDAKKLMGDEVGTKRAVFSYGDAGYKTADQGVPVTLRDAQKYLVRELYRMAHLRYEDDSREAQTAEAIRLQHQELTAMLHGIASELMRVELALAKLYFHWTSATAEEAERKFEAAKVTVSYPREFFEPDLEKEITTLSLAGKAVPSQAWQEHVAKTIVRKVDPTLSPEQLEAIDGEIETGVAEQRQQAQQAQAGRINPDQLRQNAAARLASFAQPTQEGEAA
jgi:hypothetical protein